MYFQFEKQQNRLDNTYVLKSLLLGAVIFLTGEFIPLPEWLNILRDLTGNISAGFFGIAIFYYFHERHHTKKLELFNLSKDINTIGTRFQLLTQKLTQNKKNLTNRGRTTDILIQRIQKFKEKKPGEKPSELKNIIQVLQLSKTNYEQETNLFDDLIADFEILSKEVDFLLVNSGDYPAFKSFAESAKKDILQGIEQCKQEIESNNSIIEEIENSIEYTISLVLANSTENESEDTESQ